MRPSKTLMGKPEDLADKVSSHVHGEICDNCRDVIEEEISFMFFIASLCNTLDLDLKDIIMKEYERNKPWEYIV